MQSKEIVDRIESNIMTMKNTVHNVQEGNPFSQINDIKYIAERVIELCEEHTKAVEREKQA